MDYRGFNIIRDEIVDEKVRLINGLDIWLQRNMCHTTDENIDCTFYKCLDVYLSALKTLSELQAEVEKFI